MKKIIDLDTLINFYKQSYFPMAESSESDKIKFYKPNIRFIIPISKFHCPKKLFKDFRRSRFTYKINYNFSEVIQKCKIIKRKDKDTWINEIIVDTYKILHNEGKCHSVECYDNNILIGGLYGVHLGSCFFGESMFSLKSNTSKFCLLYLLAILKKNKFSLLDSQFYNPHLIQFGAYEIDDQLYQDKLNEGLKKERNFNSVINHQEILSLIQPTSHKS